MGTCPSRSRKSRGTLEQFNSTGMLNNNNMLGAQQYRNKLSTIIEPTSRSQMSLIGNHLNSNQHRPLSISCSAAPSVADREHSPVSKPIELPLQSTVIEPDDIKRGSRAGSKKSNNKNYDKLPTEDESDGTDEIFLWYRFSRRLNRAVEFSVWTFLTLQI